MDALNALPRYNKMLAAAIVTILSYVARQVGLELPAEIQGALTTVLVYLVPNVDLS